MTEKCKIADKDVSSASLKQLREILAKQPEAAKIFSGEVNRRWGLIATEKREWLCKLAGCPEAAKGKYTELPSEQRAKIRAAIKRLERLVGEFLFALSQG